MTTDQFNVMSHETMLKAERNLLAQTVLMNEKELTNFLNSYDISRSEYDYLYAKHARLVERFIEETNKKEK